MNSEDTVLVICCTRRAAIDRRENCFNKFNSNKLLCFHPDCKTVCWGQLGRRRGGLCSLSGLQFFSQWMSEPLSTDGWTKRKQFESIMLWMMCNISNGAEVNAVIGLMKVIALSHWTFYVYTCVCCLCGSVWVKETQGNESCCTSQRTMRKHIACQVFFLYIRMGCIWLIKRLHLLAVMFPWC